MRTRDAVFAVATLLWNAFAATSAAADTLNDYIDADGKTYSTGALRLSEDRYQSIPETPLFRDFLPTTVDLSASVPSPGDQGRHGSCVAWAIGYAARSYYTQAHEGRSIKRASNIPSPAYIHSYIRHGDCADGSYIADGLDLLTKGALSLRDMPYSDKACPTIDVEQQLTATDFKIKGYRRVNLLSREQVKAELAKGNPVIFAFFYVPEDFHRAKGRDTFNWPGEPIAGQNGHAMTAVGYDEDRQAFRIINSWGDDWGDRGYLWVGYETFTKLTDEAYVIEPLSLLPAPPPKPPEMDFRCSSIATRMDGDRRVIEGFVGYEADLATLKSKFGLNATINVELRPWPQCEALLTLAALANAPDRPQISLGRTDSVYRQGDSFPVKVSTPSLPSYLHISYLQADGTVVHLEQPSGLVPSPYSAGDTVTFGTGTGGSTKFTVSAPFGQEMIIALASESPLFTKALPQSQSYREYLGALREMLSAAKEPSRARRVSAAFSYFETRER